MNITTLVGIYDANVNIVSTPKGTLVVDCGCEFEQLKKILDKSPKPISVLLTHGHFDHMYAAYELQQYGATIYVHANDAERLNSDKNSGLSLGYKVNDCTEYKTVKEGDVLNLAGLEIKVIHTPGHTEGSVCYIIDGNIFAGDTLFFEDYGRTDLYGGDQGKMIKTLKRLYALDGELIVKCGHFRDTTIAHERDFWRDKIWGLD